MIYRTVKDSNYSIISNNTYMKDKNLSFGAIGLLTLLLSCKDDTSFSLNFISMMSGKSQKIVSKYLKELKKYHYVYIQKTNTKDGFIYKYAVYESKDLNLNFYYESPDDQNPSWESPSLDMVSTNKYYNKQDKLKININELNLCFLTKYLLKVKFIEEDDTDLIGYDNFLSSFLDNNKDDYRLVLNVIKYVVKSIKSNKYLDEEGQPILNLLSYFISSCKNNLNNMKNIQNLDLYDDFEDIF